ncbi:hypothetical protein Athai_45730 [Actinocatenispora thailandica]|uniref:Uncharacterized protein n=1 Tax=Actinocatenispora thailandica TaxID=227318 RepID=A0A7R7DSY7_9ACTN|nr:hypothetical protein [Actinocatenispora thailandica]BCJ37070.1 hypothetical protein Athai_45730 [Actinocatenispora thailandica]
MTAPDPVRPAPPVRPDSERSAIEADVLRRRQLRAALLHGSSRTWRDRRRIWPAAIAGAVAVAVIVAAIAVAGAFAKQQRSDRQQEKQPHAVGRYPPDDSARFGTARSAVLWSALAPQRPAGAGRANKVGAVAGRGR